MITTIKLEWLKIAALVLFAVLFPALTLAAAENETTTVNQITTAIPDAQNFTLPTQQIEMSQAIPLGPLPPENVEDTPKPAPPPTDSAANSEIEEVEVTAEGERETVLDFLESAAVGMTAMAFIAAILSVGMPF